MKAGANLCYAAFIMMVLSAVGMIISQVIEQNFTSCSFKDLMVDFYFGFDG